MIFLSNTFVFPKVLEALARRDGKKTSLPTLESLTGFEPHQIQAAIANARRNNPDHAARITVVKVGREWKFNSDPDLTGDDTTEKIVKDVEMGSSHIWKHVLAALVKTNGVAVSKEELANRVNAAGEVEMTPQQVANAMLTILRKPKIAPEITIIQSGKLWRYVGSKTNAKAPAELAPPPVSVSIRGSVLRYFTQRPGATLFVDDVAADLGFTRKQVQSAMWALTADERSTVRDDFQILMGGQSWRYVPNRATTNGQAAEAPKKVPALALNVAAEPIVKAHVPNIPPAQFTSAGEAYTANVQPSPVAKSEPKPEPEPEITRKSTSGGRMFEEIAALADGAILIRDEEQRLFRATEM